MQVKGEGWSWVEVVDDKEPQSLWLFASRYPPGSGATEIYLEKWLHGDKAVWEAPEPGVPAPDLVSAPDLPWQVAEFVLEHYRNKVQLAPMRYGWFGLVEQRKEEG